MICKSSFLLKGPSSEGSAVHKQGWGELHHFVWQNSPTVLERRLTVHNFKEFRDLTIWNPKKNNKRFGE